MVNILAYLAATKIAADLVSRSQKARMLKRDSSSPWISAHDSLFPICIYLVSQKVKQVSARKWMLSFCSTDLKQRQVKNRKLEKKFETKKKVFSAVHPKMNRFLTFELQN